MDLSIIIPTKLAHQHLDDCLAGISKCTKNCDYEVIIIVNPDPINKPEEAEKLKDISEKNIKVIWPDEDLGIAGAINEGLKNAQGDYIFVTNDDIRIKTKNWFTIFKKEFEALPNVGTIGFAGNDFGFGGTKIGSEEEKKLLELGRLIDAVKEKYDYPPSNRQELCFNHTCSTFTKKSVLEDMNGYDEVFWPYGQEDVDLGIRLLIHGYRNFRVPLKHIHYGDDFGISRSGGSTHNIIKERDKAKGNQHNVDIVNKNWEEFNNLK